MQRHVLTALALALMLGACAPREKKAAIVVPPPPTYRGPEFLRGTIASIAELRGYEEVLVSGYGIVVGLHGTGSPDCPPVLRTYILDQMRKGGFGQARLGLGDRGPATELASGRVAVVKVRGVIPAGAPAKSRFDLEVSAMENSSTTSLEDGVLYTTELEPGEPQPGRKGFVLARGGGPVFINPFIDPEKSADDVNDPRRIGAVLAGGITIGDRPIVLVTTRPSLRLIQQIADRINDRFQPDRTDTGPLATPANETTLRIRVLNRFRDDPQRMLDLIGHLFLDPRSQFVLEKGAELGKVLADRANQKFADDVALAWEGMGKAALPVIREHYGSPDPMLQMAALQAGAGLGDMKAFDPLKDIATGGQGRRCEQAAVLLGRLLAAKPDNPQLIAALRSVLNREDPQVKVAAYQALAAIDDATIQRFAFDNRLELAQVRCQNPVIYATRSGPPRIIVFDDHLGFERPMLFSMWDSRFMLKADTADPKLNIFYKRPERRRPTVHAVPATVPYLTGVLAYNPRSELPNESPGLGLSYSKIISILNKLTQGGYIHAPLVVQQDTLAERIQRRRIIQTPEERPDTSPAAAARN